MPNPPQKKSQNVDAAEKAATGAAPKTILPFNLSSFKLEQCILETRYPQALTLWDNAGTLGRAILEKWPDVRLVKAEPAKVSFQSGKTGLIVELELAKLVVLDSTKGTEELLRIGRDFFKLVAFHLQLSLYERLGLRLIYFKEFEDRRETASAFHSLGLTKIPHGKKFEVEAQPVNPQYVLRWESEKKGALIQCRAETRKFDYDPPIESVQLFSPIHREQNGIVVDVDYYTVAPVEIGQLDMGEWMNHGLHVISRDIRYLFED